jgi:hypothetical protein
MRVSEQEETYSKVSEQLNNNTTKIVQFKKIIFMINL